ncbi:MAG: Phosphate transporter [Parcubacteria group bacterium GW2011_GWA2_43_17]|nr:MAG: Phosphate transporter [Parcubacteria group bacterium GW2011_GWA2_43_17]KKT91223.1 MAG: Phosphate transporter [Parcubacteria group bacterium GW2011_GWF2_45_11]OGY94743.1 MAG: inorganic phosphate transporter [Candidatus Komeilibacteria bacterium RIFOXYA2_FULL_45_9]HAH04268.1 anion permease [Candidatus Komeilibacteria bacterium]
MTTALWLVIIITFLAWIYDFYNGANDCANSIATTVSSRVLSPTKAIILAAVFNTVGAFISTEVAKTIGKGLLPENLMTTAVLVSAIIGAIAWSAYATHAGLPVSITHSIIGGIFGAGLVAYGFGAFKLQIFKKIVIAMITSPIFGFLIGLFLLAAIFWLFKKHQVKLVNKMFGKLQLVSASFMALTHGMNDTQNSMGIITASLLAGGFIGSFEVPTWVILFSSLIMGLGTFYGGKKVIKTMGMKMTKIRPVEGFAAETSASIVIFIASLLGLPISTTHVISTSIMGVGSVKRFSAVRWGVAKEVLVAWLLTIPAAALVSAGVYFMIERLS